MGRHGAPAAATFDLLFAEPGTIVAGAISPSGSPEAGPEGFRVNGRWGFITGVEHATWAGLNCLEVDQGGGPPAMRLAVVHRKNVVVEDTWHVSGLRGTGSQHVRAEGLEVPAAWTCNPMAGEPCLDLTILRAPAPAVVALSVSRVALGIAAGALDDISGWPGTRSRCCHQGPSRPARRSTVTSPRPTPGCAAPERCTTRPSGPSGRRRSPGRSSRTRSGRGPARLGVGGRTGRRGRRVRLPGRRRERAVRRLPAPAPAA